MSASSKDARIRLVAVVSAAAPRAPARDDTRSSALVLTCTCFREELVERASGYLNAAQHDSTALCRRVRAEPTSRGILPRTRADRERRRASVGSPIRNPLDRHERRGLRAALSRSASTVARLLARSAGVRPAAVFRGRLIGRCEQQTGIVPFGRLVEQVMTAEPYARARRVFWIVDNGSSHRGQVSADRLAEQWPNLVLVHLPFHASWLNQIEIASRSSSARR